MEIVNEKDNKRLPFIDILTSTKARKHMHVMKVLFTHLNWILATKGINDSLRNQAAARSFPVF